MYAETAEDHASILKALHGLESTLLASCQDSRRWATHVHREVIQLIDLLAQHRMAAAPPTGLLGLIQLHGHSRGVTELAATHERLVADAHALLLALDSTNRPEAQHSSVRRDAAYLAAAVRKHEADESTLIYETNVRVSGGEG